MIKTTLFVTLALFFLLAFGCTETIPGLPFTTSQFVGQITDLNYTTFVSGGYDGNFLIFDGNKLSIIDLNIPDANISGTFVPYTGATSDVDLGSNSLISGGDVNALDVHVSNTVFTSLCVIILVLVVLI